MRHEPVGADPVQVGDNERVASAQSNLKVVYPKRPLIWTESETSTS